MLKRMKPYIMLAPVMTLICGVFLAGLVMGLLQSLGYFTAIGMKSFTLKYYIQVLADSSFLESLKFSLYISFVSSVVALIIGVGLSYAILKSNFKYPIEEILYKLPVIVPHAVAALLVYSVFAQSGILARILYEFGIIQEQTQFISFLYDSGGKGIILTYLWKEIPFVAMVVFGVLSSVHNKLSPVAQNLGASEMQNFWYVLLPLMGPTLLSIFIIIFTFSFGAFEVPYLLGPTLPRTLPVLAYIEYTNPDLTNRPYTMAINMILTSCSFVLVALYSYAFKIIQKNQN